MSKTDDDITTNLTSDLSASESVDRYVGKQVGKYEIISRVAKGGTATVYQARDRVLNRDVAVKVLHEHLEQKQDVVERFKNEAQVVASLRHPNVLNIYDFFAHDGRTVLVAEYMPGSTLSALIKSMKRIPEKYVLMLGMELLNGLRAAHDKGITHRDIKPANILIHPELGVKISDFGLAKLKDADTGLTREGVFIGTPSFSSPEQIEGRPIDTRSDLFSLGLTLYMLATGQHAFKQKGDSTTTVWFKIVRGKFQAVREIDPSISGELERILSKSLQVDLDKRYQTAKQMADDIAALLKRRKDYPYQDELKAFLEKPISAGALTKSTSRKAIWISLAACLVLGLGFLVYQYFPISTTPPAPIVVEEAKPEPQPVEPSVEPSVEAKPEVKPTPKPIKKIEKPAPPVATIGVLGEPFVSLRGNSRLIFHRDRRDFNLRFPFDGEKEFSLARATSPNRKISEGRFRGGGFDWKDWSPGKFIWKAGSDSGEVEIIDWEQYKARTKATKRELVVASTYNETDLQINPWSQYLRLSWESGANATSYKVEVAEDADFKNLIFSGNSLTKSTTIDRLWPKDTSVFWRISYMDAQRNVFLIDPVRKINLKVFLSANEFDLIKPQPFDLISGGSVRIEAVAPRDSQSKCGEIVESGPTKLQNLSNQNGLFVADFKMSGDLFYCESQAASDRLFFVLPLQQ